MKITLEISDDIIKTLDGDIKTANDLFYLVRFNVEYLSRHNKNLTKAQDYKIADLYTIFENMEAKGNANIIS